jgi:hypothetical protein
MWTKHAWRLVVEMSGRGVATKVSLGTVISFVSGASAGVTLSWTRGLAGSFIVDLRRLQSQGTAYNLGIVRFFLKYRLFRFR